MTGSRFTWRPQLTPERLKDFVAIENISAQTPLIEICKAGVVRLWVAYDTTRTEGTFTEVLRDGTVQTVTIYPSGKRNAIINRPAHTKDTRVRKAKKQVAAKRKPRRSKAVDAGAKDTRTKKQRRNASCDAQINHSSIKLTQGV
jgi:hypothetical protein